MVRTHISLDEALYERAKQLARRKGISFAELCRQSLASALAQASSDKPWMVFAGTVDGDWEDSRSVDKVVHDRERP